MKTFHNEEFIVIETFLPGYELIDLSKDESYGRLLQSEKDRTLPPPTNPNCPPRAAYYHKPGMLMEYVTYDDGTEGISTREDVLSVPKAGPDGKLHIHISLREQASVLFRALKRNNNNVCCDVTSCLTEEELCPPDAPKKRGGRPRKVVSRRPMVN